MESTKFYFCPEITVVEIVPEGVLCGSGVLQDLENEEWN
jgi:hypothetical protein